MQRPTNYIAANADGTFDAMVPGHFLSRCQLWECVRHLCRFTDRVGGVVPLFDRVGECWRQVDVATLLGMKGGA